jgi:hypothetical protein
MVKKGKFKLFSFLLENYIIYYKSINKNSKLIAFSVLECDNFLRIIEPLNELLLNKYLFYYSIQLNIPRKRQTIIIISFIGENRSNIDKFFNLIREQLYTIDKSVSFLKNHKLRRHFLRVLSNNVDEGANSMNHPKSLVLKYGDNLKFLQIHQINCANLENQMISLSSLLRALKNFNLKGYMIFNIRSNNRQKIVTNAYIVDIKHDVDSNVIDLDREINQLYNCELFNKSNVNVSNIYRILWRVNVSDNFYTIHNDTNIFFSLTYFNFQDISKFYTQFAKILQLKQLDYYRLKPNLFFIEEKILFLILEDSNLKKIKKLLENFFSRYFIFILILNQKEYRKLVESKEIRLLDNLKILSFKDFVTVDFLDLNKENLLKNT